MIAVRPADSARRRRRRVLRASCKLCFAERRKTLWNNLAPHVDKKALAAAAAASGLPATIRAEQLPPDSLLRLFAALNSNSAEKEAAGPAR